MNSDWIGPLSYLYVILIMFFCGYIVGKGRGRRLAEKRLLLEIDTIVKKECKRLIKEDDEVQRVVDIQASRELEKKGIR